MTKMVRIENADTSTYKIDVEVWQVGVDGKEDTLTNTHKLDSPTSLISVGIHSHQYLKVKERKE